MASELRVNNIKNRSGLGTVTFADEGLIIAGITSLSLGNSTLIVGSAASTGTANQTLQASGGAYVSGNLGVGLTNPTSKLDVSGDTRVTGVITATTFSGNIVGTAATFTGNVSIAGTLTYEDVTNVDSVGLVTARAGAHISGGNLLVGSTSATGTSSQPLQVTGGAYVSGSVGVGKTNPPVSPILHTGSMLMDDDGGYYGGQAYYNGGWRNSVSNQGGYAIRNTGGNFTIFTGPSPGTANSFFTTFSEKLRIDGGGNVLVGSSSSTGTASQPLQVTGGGYFSGNLGVGVTNPSVKLDVIGSIQARAAATQDGVLIAGRAGGTSSYDVTITPTTLSADRTLTLADGNTTLQAGTMAITGGKLSQFAATTSAELAGVISDETGSGALVFATSPTLTTPNIGAATGTSLSLSGNLTVSTGNATGGGIILGDDGDIVDNNDGYCSMRFTSGVRVFSGNRTGSAVITLGSNGNITATGNVSGYSDIRLKDNIQTIPNALDKVSKLRGVEFDRNDIEENPHQIGVIAQEVEKIIPEVVHTNTDGIKSVSYGNLVGLLIEAIKDLKEEVNELKAKLEDK